MTQRQKETVLALLKSDKASQNYRKRYWFSYKDFLDPTDNFTSFSCENMDEKQGYIDLIENLLTADETAKIFVEVYGFEEIDNEPFIYADTLIIFSRLSLSDIKQIFTEPKDIFPDDIGEIDDLQQNYIISDDGAPVPAANLAGKDYSSYYCWWD